MNTLKSFNKTRNILAPALFAALTFTACTNENNHAKSEEPSATTSTTTTVANNGVEKKGVRIDDRNIAQDEGWKLVSITGVGESELNSGVDSQYEARFLRFNFMMGGAAVSCLVSTDAAGDLPSSNIINTSLCFIDGNISKPLVPRP